MNQHRLTRTWPSRQRDGRLRRALERAALVLSIALLVACGTNPVTGERRVQFYGEDWEQEVGGQMYAPLKQSQGGDYELDPELTRYVSEVGQRLAQQAARESILDFEFSVLNNSMPNAWALPGGKIVINRGLLTELDSEAELAAVLAHEIVHADAGHGAHQQSTGVLTQVGAVAGMVILGSTIDNPTARDLSMLVPQVGMQLIMQRYSRDAEREADHYGMLYMSRAGYDPQGAVDLQETFVELSKDRREDWLTGLFASHPPSMERVENNRRTAAELTAGGELGKERYQRRLAYLERVEPAYEAYGKAGEAMEEENWVEAQRQLDRALDLEPREVLFLAMQGDLQAKRQQLGQALETYDRAIAATDDFFYPHLRKGQVAWRLEDRQTARVSLQRSLELLPTAEAHYTLGQIERASGNRSAAVAHYQEAAGSQSEAGRKAQGELVRLDVAQNPQRYITTAAALDGQGTVWVQIQNRTGVPLRDIQVDWAWVDDSGRTRRNALRYPKTLAAGQADRFRLDLRMPDNQSLQQRFQVQVTAARPAD